MASPTPQPKMFVLGNGRKFRARPDPGSYNGLLLEVRIPRGWESLRSPDMIDLALRSLARAAIGAPVQGFAWTLSDRYEDPT